MLMGQKLKLSETIFHHKHDEGREILVINYYYYYSKVESNVFVCFFIFIIIISRNYLIFQFEVILVIVIQ